MEHLERVITQSHNSIPDFAELKRLVDKTNIGIETMSIEEAVVAAGVHWFIQEVAETPSGQQLEDWNCDNEWTNLQIDEWLIDQEQIDSAIFEALAQKARSHKGITVADRKFLQVCDAVLDFELSKSLARTVKDDLMESALEEITALDPMAANEDIDSLITQVETFATVGHAGNGSSLAETIRLVTRAAEKDMHAAAPAVGRVMQSDGTIIDINGQR